MRRIDRICCLLLLMLAFMDIKAQNYSNLELVENKGQWPSQVKFKANIGANSIFLQPDGYRMVLNNYNDLKALAEQNHGHFHSSAKDSNLSSRASAAIPDRVVLHSHAYDMKFLNASPNARIIPDKPLDTYNNYFIGNDPSKWAGNCRIFQGVTYKDIYPGVDLRYYTNEGQLKYDIIVNPGASVEKIALYFDGVSGLEVRNDRLIIKTSVDEVQELKPYTYQPVSAGRREITNLYEVNGNVVKFKIGAYDKNRTLVIDPTLIFSTFSGSTADNWGFTATYDNNGNFYGGGIVFGNGFPTNTGAFQATYQNGVTEDNGGGYDIGIIKLNSTGTTRIYATYLGGNANEQPHSLIADDSGNLIVGGRTNSANYPATLIGPGGGYDIVLTKLNSAGNALIGSLKIGGASPDGVNIRRKTEPPRGSDRINQNYGDDARTEVMLDAAGNIYLASSTQSSDFPVTAGAFQTTFGGAQDGVIIKATPTLSSLLFASFLGGSDVDAAFVLSIHPSNGNIYTGGATKSNDFPKTTAGAAISQTYQGGESDGFVAIISPNGSTHIKSTYLGTPTIDLVYGLKFDRLGFPYVTGTTRGTWPIINAVYRNTGGKQFIAKLQPDLSAYVYSTVFGKTTIPGSYPDISPVAFLVDRCENVYVAGWGGMIDVIMNWDNSYTSGLPVTSDALRSTTDQSDFYFFVLEKNATKQLYGSFWGAVTPPGGTGDHVDGGTSRFDENGVIYLAQCGFCGGGGTFQTTAGSWSTTNQALAAGSGSECNLALVKIALDLAGVSTGVKSFVNGSPRKQGCIPLTVDFNDTLAIAKQYIWNFGDGSPDVTTSVASISHTYNNIGVYTVRLIAVDSSTCNIRDTSYTTIRARQDNAQLSGFTEKLPPCEGLTYRFHNTSVPPAAPGKPFTTQSFKWVFGDGSSLIAGTTPVLHTYTTKGTYNVQLILIDTNYCNYPDTFRITLRISDNVDAQFTTPPSGCLPYNAVFKNTSAGGQSFLWDFGDGTTSNASDPTHLYSVAGTYTVKLMATDSATCNITDSAFFTITVSGSPVAGFTFTPDPPDVNGPVDFINTSTGGVTYLWNFGDGDSLFTTKRDTTIRHFYNATGTFNTCLRVTNQFGCVDTACASIVARVIPALDVPNAFTPNNDGKNDKIYVRGFAIGKMIWRIYNRWGQLVFTTTDRFEGWDGTFKGAMQPQEVYTYTLDIEFTDGTKARKTGDITLLR